ncbi:MAG: hypothetical protein KKG33_11760 [candidate division Zixibacteria bacterium]|nr:hypothetical protein [candidate division Zixibacteria bacterium]MBU2626224.1 hypothetical protein [candidate division Zixibacteria bacterium]
MRPHGQVFRKVAAFGQNMGTKSDLPGLALLQVADCHTLSGIVAARGVDSGLRVQ